MKDANDIANEQARRDREFERRMGDQIPDAHKPFNGIPQSARPRYGMLIGAVRSANLERSNPAVDANGQVLWERVTVLPMGDGLLMAEDEDGLRTIINARAYLYLEFRPDEGE